MNTLEVGFSDGDITPYGDPKTIYHRGGGSEQGETPIRDPLYARATAFRLGHQIAIWITADLLCVDGALRSRIVKALAPHGIPPDHVAISATHTHTAPTVVRFHGIVPTPDEYLSFLGSAVARAALHAVQSAQPAVLSLGKTEVDLSVNRRQIGRLARINDLASPSGLVDTEVVVATMQICEDKRTGCLFNYGAHPLTMSANTPAISADYPSRTVAHLRTRGSMAFAQFLQGCSGNVNPKIHGDTEEAGIVGRGLADVVLEAAGSAVPSQSSELRVSAETIRLPWQRIPTLKEAREVLDRERSSGHAQLRVLEWATHLCEVLEKGPVPPYAEVLVQAIRVGDAVLLALPGEVFVEIGLAIKQQADVEHLFVAGYANHCEIGYIPTASAFPEGGYEVDTAPYYYGLFQLSPECERIVVEAGLRAIRNVTR